MSTTLLKSVNLKLIHPRLGVCCDVITRIPEIVIKNWKMKYGKKFYECDIETTFLNKVKFSGIKDKITGEIYLNYSEASFATGFSIDTIRLHCKNKIGQGTIRGSYKDGIRFSFIHKINKDDK